MTSCTKPAALRSMELTVLFILTATVLVILARYVLGESFWQISGAAIPQWVLITLSIGSLIRYAQMRRTWGDWRELVDTQRWVAYRAVMDPSTVFPDHGTHTIKDLETQQVLVTNDPQVRDEDPKLFGTEPWRYVNYPHRTAA